MKLIHRRNKEESNPPGGSPIIFPLKSQTQTMLTEQMQKSQLTRGKCKHTCNTQSRRNIHSSHATDSSTHAAHTQQMQTHTTRRTDATITTRRANATQTANIMNMQRTCTKYKKHPKHSRCHKHVKGTQQIFPTGCHPPQHPDTCNYTSASPQTTVTSPKCPRI